MPCFYKVFIWFIYSLIEQKRASKDANSVNKTTSKFLVDTTLNEVNMLKALYLSSSFLLFCSFIPSIFISNCFPDLNNIHKRKAVPYNILLCLAHSLDFWTFCLILHSQCQRKHKERKYETTQLCRWDWRCPSMLALPCSQRFSRHPLYKESSSLCHQHY